LIQKLQEINLDTQMLFFLMSILIFNIMLIPKL
jgi:hypothetical protein